PLSSRSRTATSRPRSADPRRKLRLTSRGCMAADSAGVVKALRSRSPDDVAGLSWAHDRATAEPHSSGRRFGASGELLRALLRPRLRLRDHSAVSWAAPAPRPAGIRADPDPPARRLVGVGLHDLGHELARPRQHALPACAHLGECALP